MANESVQMLLGRLVAQVAGIEKAVAEIKLDAETSVRATSESRAAVHRRMDDLVGQVGSVSADLQGVKGTVTSLAGTVAQMKAVTDDVVRWRLMGMGALAVTGIGAAAIASIVTAYWAKLLRALVG